MPDRPQLLTDKQAARELGVTVRTIRTLREKKQIAYVRVAGRYMYPREAPAQYIQQNTVQPCHDQTKDHASASKEVGQTTTFDGQKPDAAVSAARAQRIAEKLKACSQSSSSSEASRGGRVIPGNFR